MADAPDVVRIGEADDADAVLFRPLDAEIHRLLGNDLTVADLAIDHDHGAIILDDLCMMVTDAAAGGGVLDISRHHADAVAVVAVEVGQHQMVCDQPGLPVRTAIGPADRHGEGVQPIGRDPDFSYSLPVRHAQYSRQPLMRGERFLAGRAVSTRGRFGDLPMNGAD